MRLPLDTGTNTKLHLLFVKDSLCRRISYSYHSFIHIIDCEMLLLSCMQVTNMLWIFKDINIIRTSYIIGRVWWKMKTQSPLFRMIKNFRIMTAKH